MDSAQKEVKRQLKDFISGGGCVIEIYSDTFIDDHYIMIVDGCIIVSPKNEQLVREELERVRKIHNSPLWKALND